MAAVTPMRNVLLRNNNAISVQTRDAFWVEIVVRMFGKEKARVKLTAEQVGLLIDHLTEVQNEIR